jgi:SAM-dependent methyltransferase
MFKDSDHSLFGKPVGDEGRKLLEEMNVHHRGLSEWALSKIPDINAEMILDIGCGGGMLISLMAAKYPDSVLYGIDISDESVALTEAVNLNLVKEGRCFVSIDSISELPFASGTFDIVTAFETYFFWPDLENDIKKASAALRDGGALIIVSEMYPHPDFNERNAEAERMCNLKLRSNDEMRTIMEGCGLDVTVNVNEGKNWVAFIGTR